MEEAFERRPLLLPVVLAILAILLFRPVLIPLAPNWVLDSKDLRDMFYPLQGYIAQTLRSGELPLWNPHQFIGHPIAGNPHAALFYPGTWFMWLVGAQRGMGLMLLFHTWLGAWGMASLARSFKYSYVGALLAGVIFAMSGWAGARYFAGHYNLLVVTAWIPWVMLFYRRALARGTLLSALPGMVALGVALLAGHPPITVYLGLLLITQWVYHIARNEPREHAAWIATRQLVVMGVGAVLLGAALVIPAAELTTRSARSSTDEKFTNMYAMPPADYLILAVPNLFGNPKALGNYWGGAEFEEYTAYVGLLPLLVLALALRWNREDTAYWIGLAALGLVLSVGLDGGLMALLWRWVPGFTFFRVPARALLLTVMAVAGLTAQVVTCLQQSDLETRREALRPALRTWLPAAAALAFGLALYYGGQAGIAAKEPFRAFMISGALAGTGVIVSGVWLALWTWTKPDLNKVWPALFTCAVITLDAWHVVIPLVTYDVVQPSPLWRGAIQMIPPGADARVAESASVNVASTTGLFNVYGYDPLPIEAYRHLLDLADKNDPNERIKWLLGVKYVMSDRLLKDTSLEQIGVVDDNYYYRRSDAFPRAWIAQNIVATPDDDEALNKIRFSEDDLHKVVYVDHTVSCPAGEGTAAITQYRPNDVTITTSGGGLLVLSDQFYPGWRAYVDNSPADIVRADTVFRAVCVPSGNHTVRFEYRPTSLLIGVVISAISWLALILFVGVRAVRARRGSAAQGLG